MTRIRQVLRLGRLLLRYVRNWCRSEHRTRHSEAPPGAVPFAVRIARNAPDAAPLTSEIAALINRQLEPFNHPEDLTRLVQPLSTLARQGISIEAELRPAILDNSVTIAIVPPGNTVQVRRTA